MKIWNLLRKRNRRTKTVRVKPDSEGKARVVEVYYDNLKNTKNPPAWMTELEEQFELDANAPADDFAA